MIPVNHFLSDLHFFQLLPELIHFSFHSFLCVPKCFIFRFQISSVLHGLLVNLLFHAVFLLILRHFVQIHRSELPSIYPVTDTLSRSIGVLPLLRNAQAVLLAQLITGLLHCLQILLRCVKLMSIR